jgi:hypothetical protein
LALPSLDVLVIAVEALVIPEAQVLPQLTLDIIVSETVISEGSLLLMMSSPSIKALKRSGGMDPMSLRH